MVSIKNRRVISVGVETTPGTAATTLVPMFAYDPMIQLVNPMTGRKFTGTTGNLPSVAGTYGAEIDFKTELLGGGSTNIEPPYAASLFTSCGWYSSASHVYTPTSNVGNYQTLTIAIFEQTTGSACIKKFATGCMGSFSFAGEDAKPGMFTWKYKGVWQTPVASTMPALPTPPGIPPRFAGTGFSITPQGGSAYTPKISKYNFDSNTTVVLIPDISQVSGFAYAIVTDRDIKGTMDPTSDSVANFPLYANTVNEVQASSTMTIGSGTGGIITMTSPAMQFMNPKEADRDRLVIDNVDFQLNQVTGDDEMSIAFT